MGSLKIMFSLYVGTGLFFEMIKKIMVKNDIFESRIKSYSTNRPFHTEIVKFRNIQCVNHGEEVTIFTRLP